MGTLKEVAGRGSLVAMIACVLATDACANSRAVPTKIKNEELSSRVAEIAQLIREIGPINLRDYVPPEVRLAQWRN